jgi:AcrR family transcriptional regulator
MKRIDNADIDNRILDEAIAESYECGLSKISTKTIASRLNISEPVIFTHFHTKKNLISSCYPRAWKMMDTMLEYFPKKPWNEISSSDIYDSLEPFVSLILSKPKELSFLAQYGARRYIYGDEIVIKSQASLREYALGVVKVAYGVAPDNFDDVLDGFFQVIVTNLSLFSRVPEFSTERAKRFLSNFILFGYKRSFQIDMIHYGKDAK